MPQTSLAVAQGDTVRASDHNKIVADIAAIIAEKGAANGIASLGADGKLTPAQAPTVGAGSISTTMLAANAVTQTASGSVQNTQLQTGSMTYQDVHANLNLTMTTSGGDLLVFLMGGPGNVSNASHSGFLAVNVNGTDHHVLTVRGTSAFQHVCGFVRITGLAAGTHAVKARFMCSTNAYTFYLTDNGTNTKAAILAVELKR
jgi:hypothetical protein